MVTHEGVVYAVERPGDLHPAEFWKFRFHRQGKLL